MEQKSLKEQLAYFGRSFALLLNRTLMYQPSHPVIKQSINDVLASANLVMQLVSPLVFILNRGLFYIDEEPLDPRINISRVANLFKNNDIQSVSFDKGLQESEIGIFAELFSGLLLTSTTENIKDRLVKRGVFNIKINHVTFKKVTEDDQVVSRDALKKATPMLDTDDEEKRKKFMETILESVLSEELSKTLNITNLMANPKSFSQKMIEADLFGALGSPEAGGGGYGGGAGAADGGSGSAGSGSGPGSGDGAGMGSAAGDGGPGVGGGPGTGSAGTPGSGGDGGPGIGGAGSLGTGGVGGFEAGGGSGPGAGAGVGSGTGGAGSDSPGEASQQRRTATGTVIDAKLSGAMEEEGLAGAASGPGRRGGASGSGSANAGARSSSVGVAGATPGGAGIGQGEAGAGGGSASGSAGAAVSTVPGAAGTTDDVAVAMSAAKGHGSLLIQELEQMHMEVEKHLQGQGEVGISDLAQAIFDMKKQLLEGIQTQKALGIAYANENAILEAANRMTDKVLMELIREEYRSGAITTPRLAYIIRRLIPEAAELKRLLPLIKKTLIAEGMPVAEFLKLIHELRSELQNEELTRVLQESAESIGVEGEDLIEEIRRNPTQAAELIYLASEIRKGGADEAALSDIMIDYVERIGNQMAKDAAGTDGEVHVKSMMTQVESTLLKKLGEMNVHTDMLTRMEQRINERMESVLDKMRVEWLHAQTGQSEQEKPTQLTVLQTLEHNVSNDEDLKGILKTVRGKVEAGEIEENNFSQIQKEIERQQRQTKGSYAASVMRDGILSSEDLLFIMEKEIARAKRYGAPFSAMALAFVTATPKSKSEDNPVTIEAVLAAALEKLVITFRTTDYIGKIGKNRILAVLPMANEKEAKNALIRILRVLHAAPLDVNGVPVQLRVAGVTAHYDVDRGLEANIFARDLSNKLADMVSRIKNVQVLF
jgi:hypothetical protein